MPDQAGYPTDEELERIRTWPVDDPLGWLAYIKTIWHAVGWGWSEAQGWRIFDKPVRRYSVSTGGWSGNEAIIEAMQENRWPWSQTWVSSRRGGHYIFEIPHA